MLRRPPVTPDVRIDAALRKHLRARTTHPDPTVAGPAELELAAIARPVCKRVWHLRRASRSTDPATRARALAVRASRRTRDLRAALEALVQLEPSATDPAPDALVTVVASALRLPDRRQDTRLRTALAWSVADGYWRARALDALSAYHAANEEWHEAAQALLPALDATEDASGDRQISLLRLATIKLRTPELLETDEAAATSAIAARALVLAMGLSGPMRASAARRLAVLRTAGGRFRDAERLWAHARELRVRAPQAARGGWIDSYTAVEARDDGTFGWSRQDDLPLENEGLPEGHGWGLIGGPGDVLVRHRFTTADGGKTPLCLMLQPAGRPAHPLLLLNSWDRPTTATERELQAASAWWATLQRGEPPESAPGSVLVDGERAKWVDCEIERLLLDAAERADLPVPPDVAASMGWIGSLMPAVFALQKALHPKAPPQVTSSYEARDYLCDIAPGAGAAAMAVLRPADGFNPARIDVAQLIDGLWRLDLSLLPEDSRASFTTLMDRARAFLISPRGSDAWPSDLTDGHEDGVTRLGAGGRAQARAATAIDRAKGGSAGQERLNSLRNAADAARGLESAAGFTEQTHLIDAEVLALIERVAMDIPDRPADVAQWATDSDRTRTRWEFNALMNAGDVLRLLGTLDQTRGASSRALQRLTLARQYFRKASTFLRRDPQRADVNQQALVCRRWATADTVLADIAMAEDRDFAADMASEAAGLAEQLTDLSGADVRQRAKAAALKIRALMVERWVLRLEAPTADEIAERDALTTRSSLENVVNWCLQHDAFGEALDLFDHVARSGSPLASWASYRSSVIAARWTEADPEQTANALARTMDVAVENPTNLTAAGDLLALVARSDSEYVLPWLQALDVTNAGAGHGLSTILAFRAIVLPDASHPVPDFARELAAIGTNGSDVPGEWLEPGPTRGAALRLIPPLAEALEAHGARHAASRLLSTTLESTFDARTWARAARLALGRRDKPLSAKVAGYLDAEKTLDPVLAVLAARLELLAGDAQAAYARLATIERRVRRAGGDVHPAVLDVQARSAVQLGHTGDARHLYQRAIGRRPMDGRAWFGLGQVERETGDHVAACRAWLTSLHADATSGNDRGWIRITARAIARAADTESASPELDELLASALAEDSRPVVSALANGLRDCGRPRPAVVEAILRRRPTDWSTDLGLGQVLMSALIWEAIAPRSNQPLGAVVTRARRLVEWGTERGVLGEVIAGAKGSYAPALLERTLLAGRTTELAALGHFATPALARAPLSAAYLETVVDAPRGDRSYYGNARQAFSRLGAGSELGTALALAVISRIGLGFSTDGALVSPVDVLARHAPAVTLDRLIEASGWVDEGPAGITQTAFFDRTAMLVLETIAPASTSWTPSLDVFEREVPAQASLGQVSKLLARGGIVLRADDTKVVCSVTRSANPGL